jgi:protein phosphatase
MRGKTFMPPKNIEAQGGKKLYSKVPFPLAKSQGLSPRSLNCVFVRPPEKIPRKILHFFKRDLKTGLPLSESKQIFMAQVFLHELEEGTRILERSGRHEQARLLRLSGSKMHLSNQMQLLREWMEDPSIRERPPERIIKGFKIRNNQNGELEVALREGKAACFTSHGLFYKDRNEDSLLIVPERGVIAVFDGMGGHIGGNIASGIVVDFLEYGLKTGMNLEKAIEFANEAVIQRTRNDPRLGGMHSMGTTVVSAEIHGNQMKAVHAGDSKLLVIRKGEIIHESQDHTNGQDLLREGLIDNETAHALNHILSRSLGCDSIFANRDLNRSDITLMSGDRVLLSSDGITDNFFAKDFTLNELAQLASSGSLEESLHQIYNATTERIRKGVLPDGRPAKPDNLTLMIYEHGL